MRCRQQLSELSRRASNDLPNGSAPRRINNVAARAKMFCSSPVPQLNDSVPEIFMVDKIIF
jgi:hypothetical protein